MKHDFERERQEWIKEKNKLLNTIKILENEKATLVEAIRTEALKNLSSDDIMKILSSLTNIKSQVESNDQEFITKSTEYDDEDNDDQEFDNYNDEYSYEYDDEDNDDEDNDVEDNDDEDNQY
jgi:hypothetical protein